MGTSPCLLEEPGELPPVVPLDPRGCAVVEAVHADVLVVVAAEDLSHEKPVREIAATTTTMCRYGVFVPFSTQDRQTICFRQARLDSSRV